MQFIYGVSVQGIQQFIFQTGKLREIVGASQLVDNICTTEFERFCNDLSIQLDGEGKILSAAGNIRYLLKEEDCRKIVRSFPQHINNYAPGITVSQAVIKRSEDLKRDMDQLEQRLGAQRNRPAMPVDIGFMGLERVRRTGGVAHEINQKAGDFVDRADRATLKKIKILQPLEKDPDQTGTLRLFKRFSGNGLIRARHVALDMSDITKHHDNGWLAIVHADGNGLGRVLRNLFSTLKGENEKIKKAFALFSQKLEVATAEAAQAAFHTVIDEQWQNRILSGEKKERLPIRPVILGGDDLTVIIRADLAFDFTKAYLKAFEEKTKEHFSFMSSAEFEVAGFENGLTACAGIAYIKETYPFHYGVHLAENLTTETKERLKKVNDGKAPSALNFYKVQASFVEDLRAMRKRTHLAKASKISFDYGPYLISEQLEGVASVEELEGPLRYLLDPEKCDVKGVSKLREWSAVLHKDPAKASFMKNRMKTVNEELYRELDLDHILARPGKIKKDEEAVYQTLINDLIVLSSF